MSDANLALRITIHAWKSAFNQCNSIEFLICLDFMKLKPLRKSKELPAFLDHYSADIAGYNPLMEEDESSVVDSPGDNLLAQFTSAVEALQ